VADKAEIVDKIEKTLEVKLASLDRMTKEDLEQLGKVLGDPSNLIRIGMKNLRGKAREELTRPLKEFLDRPLIDLLRGVTGEPEAWYPGKLVKEALGGASKA